MHWNRGVCGSERMAGKNSQWQTHLLGRINNYENHDHPIEPDSM